MADADLHIADSFWVAVLTVVEAPRWIGVLPFRGLDKLLVEWG